GAGGMAVGGPKGPGGRDAMAGGERRPVGGGARGPAGLMPVRSHPAQTQRSYYQYVVRVDCRRFGWGDVGPLAAMLAAELHFPTERIYRPLSRHPLYRPATRRGTALSAAYRTAIDPAHFQLPECKHAYDQVISFHHRLLLGDDRDMDDVIGAFRKVWEHLP